MTLPARILIPGQFGNTACQPDDVGSLVFVEIGDPQGVPAGTITLDDVVAKFDRLTRSQAARQKEP